MTLPSSLPEFQPKMEGLLALPALDRADPHDDLPPVPGWSGRGVGGVWSDDLVGTTQHNHHWPQAFLHVITWGCQMNVYDSVHAWLTSFMPLGYALTETPDGTMVIPNTCHIREKAADKVFSELGRLTPIGRKRGQPKAGG